MRRAELTRSTLTRTISRSRPRERSPSSGSTDVLRPLNDSAVSAQVVVTREKTRFRAEVTLHARGEHSSMARRRDATRRQRWPSLDRQDRSAGPEAQRQVDRTEAPGHLAGQGGVCHAAHGEGRGSFRHRPGSARQRRAAADHPPAPLRRKADVGRRSRHGSRRRARRFPRVPQFVDRTDQRAVPPRRRQPRTHRTRSVDGLTMTESVSRLRACSRGRAEAIGLPLELLGGAARPRTHHSQPSHPEDRPRPGRLPRISPAGAHPRLRRERGALSREPRPVEPRSTCSARRLRPRHSVRADHRRMEPARGAARGV